MNLFFGAAVLVTAFMAATVLWLMLQADDEASLCAGWWAFPSAILGLLIVLGVLL